MATLPPGLVGGSYYAIYEKYYQQIDALNKGTIGALEAATFLKKSGLSDKILSKIWDIADANGKGYLTKSGFFIALKLVALVQAGKDISTNNLTLDVPPPKMGIPITPSPSPSPSSMLSNNINKMTPSIPSVLNTSDWAMKPEEKMKYDKLFDSLQPLNGAIPGNKVKGLLMDSKLSVDTLGLIWDLADMDKDGALNRHEFCVAMHLVYKALEKYAIPSCLPPELLPPEKRKDSSSLPGAIPVLPVIPNGIRSATPDIINIASPPSSTPLIPSTYSTPVISKSVVTPPLVSSPLVYSTVPLIPAHSSPPTIITSLAFPVSITTTKLTLDSPKSSVIPNTHSFAQQQVLVSSQIRPSPVPWVITPEEKAKYDVLFHQADLDRDGYVSGNEIKNVFLQSGVEQRTLAKIWGLCDTEEKGKLRSDQFALALWLISRKLKGIDPPDTLTPEMVPPSCRNNASYNLPQDNFMPVSDPAIDELNKNVQRLMEDRVYLEKEIEKRKEDIKVKSEEVENLESEFNALMATLKQLEMQKQEAQKRLNDLQTQTNEIQAELSKLSVQVDEEQQEVDKLKQQVDKQEAILKAQEEELNSRKKQLDQLNKEEENANKRCTELEAQLQNANTMCEKYKQQAEELNNKVQKVEEFKAELEAAISNFEIVIDANDIEQLVESNLNIEPKFRDPIYTEELQLDDADATLKDARNKSADVFDGPSRHNVVNSIHNVDFSKAFQNDAFSTAASSEVNKPGTPDPFSSGGLFNANFANNKTDFNEDPFAPITSGTKSIQNSFSDDELANRSELQQQKEQDPFGCDPFAILHAPPKINSNATTPSPRSESPSPALPPKKSKQPPPRPAPPRPAPPAVHNATGFDPDFADFSSFDKMASVVTSGTTVYGSVSNIANSASPLTIKDLHNNATVAKDPFRDYRYDDPFTLADDFHASGTVPQDNSGNVNNSKYAFEPANDAFFAYPSKPSLSNNGLSKSTPVSPLPSEDQQLAWAKAESVKLEQERRKQSVQEKADLELALKLSKSENKKRGTSFRSRIFP